jgi:asparagine synthase (glutamine-hydrolysing)
MCGIFGAVGPLPPHGLDAVSRSLEHRGPDAEGRFSDGLCTLYHRRLKIIDLSDAAAQPMTNEDGSVHVVFNGEIYNHHELRRELEALGHTFRSRSDTEVLVHGYEAWGDQLVRRIDGMFAFGVWDARRGRLFLARDRSGKKPLFYAEAGGSFRFASSVAALRASGLQARPDASALPIYLAYGFVPAPATFFEGIRQLPPAGFLARSGDGAISTGTYWEPSFSGDCRDDYATARGRVRELVTRAVERRLESDVPLGAFLSGGIDSTIIVGVMAQRLGSAVRTFSIGFAGDARYDETSFARLAASRFGTDHTEFRLEPTSFELVEELVRHHDGPFGDSSAIPTYVVSRLTRKHVTVALTGDGGDELFCGYVRFLAAELADAIPSPLRRLAGRVSSSFDSGDERSTLGRMLRFFKASSLPVVDRIARWGTFFPNPAALLRPEVAASLPSPGEAPLRWQRDVFALGRGRATLSRVLEHNFRTYLPFDLLVKADRCSMANSLETRSPFLDTALIEYAASLPPSYLRRGWTTKRILKDAFSDLLPSEIRNRGKMGFGVPLGTWFRGDLREYLCDRLGEGARCFELLDPGAVKTLLDEHLSGAVDHGHRLWALLTLEVWLRSLGEQKVACAA